VRVSFSHREKFRLRGPNQLEVVVSIYFSEFEEAIIATCGLKHFVILERMPTVFKEFYNEWREIDNNIYLEQFLRDTHAEPVISPAHAKVFEQDMLLALEPVERYLNRHSTPDVYHGAALPTDLTKPAFRTSQLCSAANSAPTTHVCGLVVVDRRRAR
jgi:hypothetical protein